jgi:hypothetical protein
MNSDPTTHATEIAHLYGGRYDGDALLVPINTSEIQIPQKDDETILAFYYFCPVLSAVFRRPTHRSADILPQSFAE